MPSLQWTMNGRGTYAVYHSSLDTFDYIDRFVDPGFVHTPALARVMGLAPALAEAIAASDAEAARLAIEDIEAAIGRATATLDAVLD